MHVPAPTCNETSKWGGNGTHPVLSSSRFAQCVGLFIFLKVSLLMQALTDQQQFGKADEMYDKCIDLEPDNATTYVHKGYVLLSHYCLLQLRDCLHL